MWVRESAPGQQESVIQLDGSYRLGGHRDLSSLEEDPSKARLDELAERFEEIEHQQFGADGFENALERIGRIEKAFGTADLAAYTSPAVPRE